MELSTIIIIVVVAIILLWFIVMYNGLIKSRNAVKQSWSGIDVQLKRRADLIPNLVNTVKGYAKHEKELLENVTKARSAIMSAKGDVAKSAKADGMLTSTLKSLFAVAENYPNLKANENFIKLQEELSITENQISSSRRIYNDNVTIFNNKIEVFPNNMFSNALGFTKSTLFEATEEEKQNVKVEF